MPEAPIAAIGEVIDELRRLARSARRRLPAGETLATTALVHEAYLKLSKSSSASALDRRHFFALAARAMREILVDAARRRQVRGVEGDVAEDFAPTSDLEAENLVAVDQALHGLAEIQPRLAEVVMCRFFAGYTEEETADILAVDVRTVQRDWVKARAWLAQWHQRPG